MGGTPLPYMMTATSVALLVIPIVLLSKTATTWAEAPRSGVRPSLRGIDVG